MNFIYAVVRSSEDADDLSQETFFARLRAPGHLQSETGEIFHLALPDRAQHRPHAPGKDRRRPPTEDLYEEESLEQKLPDQRAESAPEERLIAADDERTLRTALQHIPEKMRTALVLRYFQHLEYQEIADTMQVSLGNVKTLIHRGKAALARQLAAALPPQARSLAMPPEVLNREMLCV